MFPIIGFPLCAFGRVTALARLTRARGAARRLIFAGPHTQNFAFVSGQIHPITAWTGLKHDLAPRIWRRAFRELERGCDPSR
jgi:hypothetical protein